MESPRKPKNKHVCVCVCVCVCVSYIPQFNGLLKHIK